MIVEIASLATFSFIWFLSSRQVHRYFLLNKHKIVIESLTYFLNKSYGNIYNDQIIGYTASGQKVIPPDEMETIERNFIKLAFELMGTSNERMFMSFFGNRSALIKNMLLYVRTELTQDAIAQMIQDQETTS
jgi:hypothetical protein